MNTINFAIKLIPIFLITFQCCYSQPGSLDNTFGSGGIVTTSIGTGLDVAYSLAIQSDGKLVAAGRSNDSIGPNYSIARYNVDGSLDNTFSGDGKLILDVNNSWDWGRCVSIQNDGKILLGGYSDCDTTATGYDFMIVRFLPNGNIDSTYGTNGMVLTDFLSTSVYMNDMAIQSDGKLIAIGWGNFFGAVARYNTDGSLDSTFGSGGRVTINMGGNACVPNSVAIQTDGKIVLSGSTFVPPLFNVVLAVRLNSDGSFDNTFDGDGKATFDVGPSNEDGYGVYIQNDGKILLCGSADSSSFSKFLLLRLNTNGTLDNSLDADGIVTTSIGSPYYDALSVVEQIDGKILLGGYSIVDTIREFALARYQSNGSLDLGFGTGGITITGINSDDATAHSMLIQPDNKIVLAGVNLIGANNDFALARYHDGYLAIQSESSEFELNIYPNPASEIAIFEFDNPLNQKTLLKIFDVHGNAIFSINNLTTNKAEIHLENWAKGMYFVQVIVETKLIGTEKFLVK